jgi:hypothetical protein
MTTPQELLEVLGDKIRAAGAPVLAYEYEQGKVTLSEVCKRLPGLADRLRATADKLTLTGACSRWAYMGSPRAGVRDGGSRR